MHYQWLFFATLVANAPPVTPPPPPTYISDRLSVALHSANAPDAPIIKQVIGGVPVKVLSRDGALLKIRTEDGSVGWVERELVTTDTPIHVLYLELSDRFTKAQETIKSLQNNPATTSAATPQNESKIVSDLRAEIKNTLEHAVELEKHIRDNSKQTYDSTGRVRELEAENAALKAEATKSTAVAAPRETSKTANLFPTGTTPGAPKFSVSLPWFLASLGLVLVLGIVFSWLVMGKRLRKRLADFALKRDRHA